MAVNALAKTIVSSLVLVGVVGVCTGCRDAPVDGDFAAPRPVSVALPEGFGGAESWPLTGSLKPLSGAWSIQATISQTATKGPPLRIRVVVKGETTPGGDQKIVSRDIEPSALADKLAQWPQNLLIRLGTTAGLNRWLNEVPPAPSGCNAVARPPLKVRVRGERDKLWIRAGQVDKLALAGWIQHAPGEAARGRIEAVRETRMTGKSCHFQQVERYTIEWTDEVEP